MEDVLTHDETSNDRKDKNKKRSRKEGKDRTKGDKLKGRKKPTDGPMHFTANNEPRALEVLGDLDPSVFEEVSKNHYFKITTRIMVILALAGGFARVNADSINVIFLFP